MQDIAHQSFKIMTMIKTIGYVSGANPFEDRRAWSGLIYKIREGIENAGYNVEWIPVKRTRLFTLAKMAQKLCYGRNAMTDFTNLSFRILAKEVQKNIGDVDSLFFPGGAQVAKFLKTDLPVIYYGDATYHQMIGYYWHEKSASCLCQGNETERAALERSNMVIKASQWTIDSVIKDYGQNPNKCHVLEFGANLDEKDIVPAAIYKNDILNVLFSGVDWERKGADIAMDTIRILNERGINAKLIFCGINEENIPEKYKNLEYVEYLGFLNKNDKEQYNKYIETIKRSHIFLLPTKAECAGVVFSESSAYGLPIFTYNTGGIPNYVVDGVNGYKLPLGSGADKFADKIEECLRNDEFEKLGEGGKKLYKEKLSWAAWSRRFKELMENANL